MKSEETDSKEIELIRNEITEELSVEVRTYHVRSQGLCKCGWEIREFKY